MEQQPEQILKYIKYMGLVHLREEHQRYTRLIKGHYDRLEPESFGAKDLWERLDDYVSMLRLIQERAIARKYKWDIMPLDEIQAVVDEELQS